VRAVVQDEQVQMVFRHALWLIVMGSRRGELSLVAVWEVYDQRYDLEHYFRFGQQRLLLAAFQKSCCSISRGRFLDEEAPLPDGTRSGE